MNAPYLESSEQLDCLLNFPLNKIKFHILKKSKYLIQRLRPFKYKKKCELCDNTQDKEKRGNSIGE